jgi:ring-1,2-phenylacetyl-CoA epoxidase subunit PaaE
MSRSPAVFHPLHVAAIDPVTEDSVTITFHVPEALADDYDFTAGQHVVVRTGRAGDEQRRSYSICSPAGSGVLRIGVKRLRGGAFSERALMMLRPGDVLEVMTPSGRFGPRLDPARRRHYGCVAAGSGITPILSIVATALALEPRSSVTLVYGNRTQRSVMFLEELADLKDTYPDRFSLVHVLSREPQAAELFSGRIDGARMRRLLESVVSPDIVDEWFLCGPQQMVVDLRALLLGEGVPRHCLHAELFHVESGASRPAGGRTRVVPGRDRVDGRDGAAGHPAGARVSVTLAGRSSSMVLAPDGPTVLDGVLAVRADAPFACRGGVCGTCRAKVVAGSAEMDTNWALEPEEVQRGYVLTCQSRPTSPTLVLDYDA